MWCVRTRETDSQCIFAKTIARIGRRRATHPRSPVGRGAAALSHLTHGHRTGIERALRTLTLTRLSLHTQHAAQIRHSLSHRRPRHTTEASASLLQLRASCSQVLHYLLVSGGRRLWCRCRRRRLWCCSLRCRSRRCRSRRRRSGWRRRRSGWRRRRSGRAEAVGHLAEEIPKRFHQRQVAERRVFGRAVRRSRPLSSTRRASAPAFAVGDAFALCQLRGLARLLATLPRGDLGRRSRLGIVPIVGALGEGQEDAVRLRILGCRAAAAHWIWMERKCGERTCVCVARASRLGQNKKRRATKANMKGAAVADWREDGP